MVGDNHGDESTPPRLTKDTTVYTATGPDRNRSSVNHDSQHLVTNGHHRYVAFHP